MSKEYQPHPEIYDPPLDFHTQSENHEYESGMYIHSLGHVALSNEVGQEGSSSYHVAYYSEANQIYKKLRTNNEDGPEYQAIPCQEPASRQNIKGYRRLKMRDSFWIAGFAMGREIDAEFVFRYSDESATAFGTRFSEKLSAMNQLIAQHMHEDFDRQHDSVAA